MNHSKRLFFSTLYALFLLLFIAPRVAYAHNFIPDGHATILTRLSPFAYALLTLLWLTSAGALVAWHHERQQRGLSVARIPLLLSLIVVLSLAASCQLRAEQRAQHELITAPPNAISSHRP